MSKWYVYCYIFCDKLGVLERAMRMELGEAILERRTDSDRRNFSWRTVFYGFTRSRRHGLRRVEDADILFLDWHHPWLFFLSVGTMLLSCSIWIMLKVHRVIISGRATRARRASRSS